MIIDAMDMYRNYKGVFRGVGQAVLVSYRPLLGLAGPMTERARFRCKGAGGRRTFRAGEHQVWSYAAKSHACWSGALLAKK